MSRLLPLRPSGLYRSVFGCPGSRRVEGRLPPSPPSEYAVEGTAAHELAAVCLRTGTRADEHLGESYEGCIVTPDMAKAVQVYLDTDAKVCARGSGWAWIEHWLPMPFLGGGRGGGTADRVVALTDVGELHMLDYKHGAGVYVDHRDNPQLRAYGLGALRHLWQRVLRRPDMPRSVHLWIIQPRCYGEPARCDTIAPEALFAWEREFEAARAVSEAPDAPLRAGEHCRFCDAKPLCLTFAEWAAAGNSLSTWRPKTVGAEVSDVSDAAVPSFLT